MPVAPDAPSAQQPVSAVARPLSPHLQVYRPQLTSVLSITHRATGVGLAIGTLLLVWWLVAAATGPEQFNAMQRFLGTWLGKLLLLGWTFSLFFHLANGIRHLFWDAGYGFTLRTTYMSGWLVVLAALVLTALTWMWGMP
jgi:succinate dehydrogenase / fumarate reductase cytochrome b subunit